MYPLMKTPDGMDAWKFRALQLVGVGIFIVLWIAVAAITGLPVLQAGVWTGGVIFVVLIVAAIPLRRRGVGRRGA
jgi:hypothetical protein